MKCRNLYRNEEKYNAYANRNRKKNYNKTSWSVNSNQRWTEDEIDIILTHEKSDFEIAQELGRSVQSIQIKRARLKNRKNDKRVDSEKE